MRSYSYNSAARVRSPAVSRGGPWPWGLVRGLLVLAIGAASLTLEGAARSRSAARGGDTETAVGVGSAAFAPLPEGHPLAGVWNDPEFMRRLMGSYGFHSSLEPRMSAEEQALYRDKILPRLRDDAPGAIAALQSAATPGASALFDYTLGTVYFQAEDLTNALTHYEAALAKFPDFLRAQRNLALVLVRSGRYADAIRPLTRALALGGGDGTLFGLLAFAQVNEGRFLGAEAAYRQALLYDPENLDYQLGLVKCQVATASYDAALALLSELLAKHPERESLWTLQANIHVQRNQLPEAAVNFEILRRLGKATPVQLSLLGDLYVTLEARELALGAYLAATEADGGTNLVRALRSADVLASRGAWSEAAAVVARARGLAGGGLAGDDELKLLRIEARIALASGGGESAVALLERILEKNPLDGESMLMAGDYYRQAGDTERAIFRYDTAAKLEGFEARALVKHAQVLVEGQRYPQAIELLRRAQKLEPREQVQRYLERVEQVAARARG